MHKKKLIIIFGSPRTGTTHMLKALDQHHMICGVNEPPGIDIWKIGDASMVDELWNRYQDKSIMALKAPGYCFAYDYFESLSDYECKYIFTEREIVEIIYSMCGHAMSRHICTMNFESVDCPLALRDKFCKLWHISGDCSMEDKVCINRSALRCLWHIHGIHPQQRQVSLRMVPYSSRRNGFEVARKIENHLGIPEDENMTDELNKFKYRDISKQKRLEILDMIIPEVEQKIKEGI